MINFLQKKLPISNKGRKREAVQLDKDTILFYSYNRRRLSHHLEILGNKSSKVKTLSFAGKKLRLGKLRDIRAAWDENYVYVAGLFRFDDSSAIKVFKRQDFRNFKCLSRNVTFAAEGYAMENVLEHGFVNRKGVVYYLAFRSAFGGVLDSFCLADNKDFVRCVRETILKQFPLFKVDVVGDGLVVCKSYNGLKGLSSRTEYDFLFLEEKNKVSWSLETIDDYQSLHLGGQDSVKLINFQDHSVTYLSCEDGHEIKRIDLPQTIDSHSKIKFVGSRHQFLLAMSANGTEIQVFNLESKELRMGTIKCHKGLDWESVWIDFNGKILFGRTLIKEDIIHGTRFVTSLSNEIQEVLPWCLKGETKTKCLWPERKLNVVMSPSEMSMVIFEGQKCVGEVNGHVGLIWDNLWVDVANMDLYGKLSKNSKWGIFAIDLEDNSDWNSTEEISSTMRYKTKDLLDCNPDLHANGSCVYLRGQNSDNPLLLLSVRNNVEEWKIQTEGVIPKRGILLKHEESGCYYWISIKGCKRKRPCHLF